MLLWFWLLHNLCLDLIFDIAAYSACICVSCVSSVVSCQKSELMCQNNTLVNIFFPAEHLVNCSIYFYRDYNALSVGPGWNISTITGWIAMKFDSGLMFPTGWIVPTLLIRSNVPSQSFGSVSEPIWAQISIDNNKATQISILSLLFPGVFV